MKLATLFLSLLILINSSYKAGAQGFNLSKNSKDKVEILSDEGVEWRQKEKIVTTLGRSSAQRGNVTILADKLMANYQSSEGNPYDIQKINGEGNVIITSVKEQAFGDDVEYSLKDGLMILHGSPAKIKMPEELILARDKIEYYGNDKKAIAYGNATVIKDKSKITADKMTVFFKNNPKSSAFELDYLLADGNVFIKTPSETMTGSHGRYDQSNSTSTLTGNVKVLQNGNELEGEKAVINLKTGVSRLLAGSANGKKGGKVKGVFTPSSNNNKMDANN